MEFDGQIIELPAHDEKRSQGCFPDRFQTLSTSAASWAMAQSAGLSALEMHHQAELDRLHPLTDADHLALISPFLAHVACAVTSMSRVSNRQTSYACGAVSRR